MSKEAPLTDEITLRTFEAAHITTLRIKAKDGRGWQIMALLLGGLAIVVIGLLFIMSEREAVGPILIYSYSPTFLIIWIACLRTPDSDEC